MSIVFSPSQINLYLNEPSIWIMNRFEQLYSNLGVSNYRGVAVENAVTSVITKGDDIETALEGSYKSFEIETKGQDQEEIDKERVLISPMVKQALDAMGGYGVPNETQKRYEDTIGGYETYSLVDFVYDEFDVDLKSTKRCPSSIETVSKEHLRQISFYRYVSGKEQRICYVTDKKFNVITLTDDLYEESMSEIHRTVDSMVEVYNLVDSHGLEYVYKLFPPRNTSSFYWDDNYLKLVKERWP